MPCNSDYLAPNSREIELSRVLCLLAETFGEMQWKGPNDSWWMGQHPTVYNEHISKEKADKWVSQLCAFCQLQDVTNYSLEMQMWWRDHQEADKRRVEAEMKRQKTTKDKAAALAKLTPYERLILLS